MRERRRGDRGGPRPLGDHYRGLIRAWARTLRGAGFTDEQAARLVFTKLLYIRGHFRRPGPAASQSER